MNIKEAKKKIEKLKKEVRKHRYNYHVLNKESLSPAVLDSLKKELFDLEQEYPELITQDSPTQRIGGKPLDKFKKVKHLVPMLSFNDAFNEEDIKNWLKRLENHLGYKVNKRSTDGFYCELKFDGLAVELVYENGVLVQGSTRGDGKIGEDVTQNLKTIETIPLKLNLDKLNFSFSKKLVIRGEVLITKNNFKKINKFREKNKEAVYANPRNLAAGTIRQLDPRVVEERSLDFFAYDIALGLDLGTHREEHEVLKKIGFREDSHSEELKRLEDVFKFRDKWKDKRDELDYEIDGVVVQVNNNKIHKEAGVVGKAPRGTIAYKFPAKEATTKIKDIKIQVGRTGALTPVAVLEPVEVGGITIAHASLHNEDQIERLGVRIGDTVVVSRAGDVIPQVTEVLSGLRTGVEKKFKMPKKCPIDGSEIKKDGVVLKCSNPRCGARNKEQLYHFVSRLAFNMDGVGPRIIDKFLDEGLIADFSDLFELKAGDIEALEGFGEKSAQNILKELKLKKEIDLSRFIYSLGIIHIGEENSILLANEITTSLRVPKGRGNLVSPTDVLETLTQFEKEELENIRDIGPEIAESVYGWVRDKYNKKLVERLSKVGVRIVLPKQKNKKSNKLVGKSLVLTGSMVDMTRDEAKKIIRQLGGKVSSTVSSKTDYLVVGESPGSKLEEAKKNKVKIINEKEFLELVRG
ncbi:MAG: NAD-dependent DNA ligase LigA [Candidatus Paceibacterota bacterium]